MNENEAARLRAAAKVVGQQDRVTGQFAELIAEHLIRLALPAPVEQAPVVVEEAPAPVAEEGETN
jgi:hypothetical protein